MGHRHHEERYPDNQLTPTNSSGIGNLFDATLTSISVGTLNGQLRFINESTTFIGWQGSPGITEYSAGLNNMTLWGGALPSVDSPIATVATVPEPSSAVLASIGAVVAVLAYGWSRHPRAQHRLAADCEPIGTRRPHEGPLPPTSSTRTSRIARAAAPMK